MNATKVLLSLVLLASIFTTSVCFARSSGVSEIKDGLGEILGAEEDCDLNLNQQAIADFIDKNVPKDDFDFAEDVKNHAQSQHDDFSGLTPSSKTAYCTQVRRVAQHYKLLN